MPQDDKQPPAFKNESDIQFIRQEISRARMELQSAVKDLGREGLRAANPLPWLKRYPVPCGVIMAAGLTSAALFAVRAMRKPRRESLDIERLRKALSANLEGKGSRSKGVKLLSALAASLGARLLENSRQAIVANLASKITGKTTPRIIPNPNLEDVVI